MNAVPMIEACGRHQLDAVSEPTWEDFRAAGMYRLGMLEPWTGIQSPEWSTWCDRCGCDHGPSLFTT